MAWHQMKIYLIHLIQMNLNNIYAYESDSIDEYASESESDAVIILIF